MKKFLIAAPLALAAGAIVATPASAAPFANAGQLRAEIAQLDRQVDNLRGVSPREEQRLERQVDQLQRLYRDYARNGFSRTELQRLDGQVNTVKAQLFAQAHDRNGRFDRFDRFDRNDRGGRDQHFGHDGRQDGRGDRR